VMAIKALNLLSLNLIGGSIGTLVLSVIIAYQVHLVMSRKLAKDDASGRSKVLHRVANSFVYAKVVGATAWLFRNSVVVYLGTFAMLLILNLV